MTTSASGFTTDGERFVQVFRAVCHEEFDAWNRTRTFQVSTNSVEGKWFALKRDDAAA